MGKLDKNLAVGKSQTITVNAKSGSRQVTFKRVAMTGFPQWRIMKSK